MDDLLLQQGPLGVAVLIMGTWISRLHFSLGKARDELATLKGCIMTRSEFREELKSQKDDYLLAQRQMYASFDVRVTTIQRMLERVETRLDTQATNLATKES